MIKNPAITEVVSEQRVDWTPRPARVGPCPVCGDLQPKPFVLRAAPSWEASEPHDLFACPTCKSKFFPDLKTAAYEVERGFEGSLKFYLEVGAALDLLIAPPVALNLKPGDHYLEVGCGFGFGLDFARLIQGLDVLGIDPSRLAAAGRQMLELPLLDGYLTPETDLGGRAFEGAMLSEVIEHIFEPVSFLRMIAARLSADGVLMLSTPYAGSVTAETSMGVLLPLLSPGWHCILYSAEALKLVLEKAGFRHISVVVREHTVLASATNGSRVVDLSARPASALLDQYLAERTRQTVADGWLHHGLVYRRLKALANAGAYPEALKVYEDLRESIQRVYRIDIDHPGEGWLVETANETFDNFALRYPMCLCGVFYFRGIIALNHEVDAQRAEQAFDHAARYGRRLRQRLQAISADDGETENFTNRSVALRLKALAYRAPGEAADQALARAQAAAVTGERSQFDLVDLFVHLANIGALRETASLAPAIEAALCIRHPEVMADITPLRGDAHAVLGRIAANEPGDFRRTAAHFAAAVRAMRHAPNAGARHDAIVSAQTERAAAWISREAVGPARRAAATLRRMLVNAPVPGSTRTRALRVIQRAEVDAEPFLRLANAAAYAEALAAYVALRTRIHDRYALDIDRPVTGWLHEMPGEALDVLIERYPQPLADIGYARGVIALNFETDPMRAERAFDLAIAHGDLQTRWLASHGDPDPSADDLIERSRALKLRALAYRAPGEAVKSALDGLARPLSRATQDSSRLEGILDLYCHLTGLGAVADAAHLEAHVIAALPKERSKPTDTRNARRIIALRTALGTVALNWHRDGRRAIAHFALAERAALQALRLEPTSGEAAIARWQARAERVQAWLVTGPAARAHLISAALGEAAGSGALPPDLVEKVNKLMHQLLRERR